MIRDPKSNQSQNDNTDGDTYDSESTVVALAQADRFCRCVSLHPSQKLIGQSRKAIHAHPLRVLHTGAALRT
jgi:hypothetical protein